MFKNIVYKMWVERGRRRMHVGTVNSVNKSHVVIAVDVTK
jgi:hypothetical protein